MHIAVHPANNKGDDDDVSDDKDYDEDGEQDEDDDDGGSDDDDMASNTWTLWLQPNLTLHQCLMFWTSCIFF